MMFYQLRDVCKFFLAGGTLDGVYMGKHSPTVSVVCRNRNAGPGNPGYDLTINGKSFDVDNAFDASQIIFNHLHQTEVDKLKPPQNNQQSIYDNLFA